MTEFESATLAYQYAGLWVAGSVGAAQCLLIGFGLWLMRRAFDHWDEQHAEFMTAHTETMGAQERQHAVFMAAHTETMTALEQQHAEFMAAHAETMTAQEQQHAEFMTARTETMTAQKRQHAETMTARTEATTALAAAIAALEQQSEALRVAIQRTAPAGMN